MRKLTLAAVAAASLLSAGAAMANEMAGEFKIGSRGMNIMASNVAVTYSILDPEIRGVTCFVTTVEARGMTFSSDPSNSSIACRQTGALYESDMAKAGGGKEGEIIFSASKGGLNKSLTNLFKALNVRRIWDPETRTYLYVSYATKAIEGSHKVSMSAVTTFGQTLLPDPVEEDN